MHAEANLSQSTLSSHITTAAFKRSHEIKTHTYFKKLFICKSIMIFQKTLNAQRSCEAVNWLTYITLYTCVKQVQILERCLLPKDDILGLTMLVANTFCQYFMF